ncbi:deubiquitinase DESI2-like isoform X2 [Oculina patagonica]
MSGYPVVLNVYDMYWINQYTFPVGLGVFHSGVVVHGKEYAFGGHPNNWSGIFEMSPKSVEVLGDDFKFRETITIGTTKLLPGEVEDLLKRMGKNYQGRCYHLIDKNCNHFTSEFCQTSLGRMKMIDQMLRPNTDDKYSNLFSNINFCNNTIAVKEHGCGSLKQKLCLMPDGRR